jgi:hypothetical protein
MDQQRAARETRLESGTPVRRRVALKMLAASAATTLVAACTAATPPATSPTPKPIAPARDSGRDGTSAPGQQ